jgi:diguanylate cyclase (GGDEF)-like protein/PAS domain S-box-containing protein
MSAFIAVYAWHNRATRGSKLLSVFMAAMTIYVMGYSMELASLDLPTMLFWSKIGYLGIFFFPTLFLIFVLQYTGREKWLGTRFIILMFLVPTFLLICKYTDDIYHLVYSQTWVDTSGLIPMLGFTRGPVYPLALYACIPVSLGIFLLLKKQKFILPFYREQIALIVISAIFPLLIFLLYMSGTQPFPRLKYLDYNAFMFILWGIGVTLAIFRYRLFEIAPIARDALIERLSEGVVVLDHQARIVDANPAAMKIFGWDKLPISQDAGLVFSSWKELKQTCLTITPDESVRLDIRHISQGVDAAFDMNITSLQDEIGRNIGRLIVIHDITERKQLEEELRELSLVDELTGLSNRRGFYVLATQFINMSNRMDLKAAVIFADLDWLKMINDSYGHAEGDQALIDTANLLRKTFRSSDIIARLSGDEFAILATESKSNLKESMLERFKRKLVKLNSDTNRKYPLSISFGVAHYYPDHPRSLEVLMQEADKAMYEEKLIKKGSLNE